MSKSLDLKQQGNQHFQNGDYVGADSLYSKAIIADPKNPALYTNRAMARLKLNYWDSVITDCQTCLTLTPSSMKAHYYLSQALLSIGDYEESLSHAIQAHQICSTTNDKSLTAVTAMVLKCKKEQWDHKEKLRLRETKDLESDVLRLLTKDRDEMLAGAEGDEFEMGAIREESERKMGSLRDVFERARVQSEKRREMPEWLIDDISFGVMVDPVITKTGKSYERAAIMEHLRRHPSDPLTREPLRAGDLRPNLGLRQACEDFINENGWAVDW
ncbi:hypothetical protein QQS21_006017 [Conoideocrella luteorostrata]|uniref:U-box domain-containing protein n=1 Tax=Conoideocrella luteorostrata TaxID=1105319 RepID=A0AAJ0CPE7_9HYPO|nr:hypothetical protein QQS21_006017 [Conoideocrella luteorostrata]